MQPMQQQMFAAVQRWKTYVCETYVYADVR